VAGDLLEALQKLGRDPTGAELVDQLVVVNGNNFSVGADFAAHIPGRNGLFCSLCWNVDGSLWKRCGLNGVGLGRIGHCACVSRDSRGKRALFKFRVRGNGGVVGLKDPCRSGAHVRPDLGCVQTNACHHRTLTLDST